jgi:septal ring factor EnvC (AmiA/AmiB activator)
MQIPDWAWKLLTSLIIPIALWAIATHVTNSQHELRINQIEKELTKSTETIQTQKDSINSTKQDIEILKVRMDYVASGIDDIKHMLEEQSK